MRHRRTTGTTNTTGGIRNVQSTFGTARLYINPGESQKEEVMEEKFREWLAKELEANLSLNISVWHGRDDNDRDVHKVEATITFGDTDVAHFETWG